MPGPGPGRPFALSRLQSAVDAARLDRGLTWAAVARDTRVSATTLRRPARGGDMEADGILAMVGWLGVAPEDFIDGETPEPTLLPDPGPSGLVRVDTTRVRDALLGTGHPAPRLPRPGARISVQNLAAASVLLRRPVADFVRVEDES